MIGSPREFRKGCRTAAHKYARFAISCVDGCRWKDGNEVATISASEKFFESLIFSMFSTCNQFRGVWRKVEAFER